LADGAVTSRQAAARLDDDMIDRSKLPNSFEFVVAAGARARQLLAGSTPRVVVGEHKKTTVAQKEIVTKAVETIKPGPRQ
jgi:DNA-directed RNA polymerase omega subunit